MKRYLFLLLSFFALNLYAQQGNLTGTAIAASDKEPMIGLTVLVKGTTNGTVTDLDGNYTLTNVPKDATIVFSMIGYKTQEVKVNGKNVINVVMEDDTQALDEVVVIGYGAVKKSDLTSSISAIKGDELKKLTGGNAMNALQGKINGVQITGGGGPGTSPRVIIRGVSTVNGSDPLYVVDGMPVGTNINFLDQNDIESMQVLKDASAAAIYGTRGSNGVVLITTKKGKKGATQFGFSASAGFQTLKKPEMAKASEYEYVFKARYINDNAEPRYNSKENITDAEGTDWWDESMKKTALIHNYNFNFSGGTDKLLYSANIGYFGQDSQYTVGNWQKLTARFSMEYTFNSIVKAGIDFTPKYENWTDAPNLLGNIMAMDPTTPIMRPQSEWTTNKYDNYARSSNNLVWNPVAQLARMDKHSDEYGLLANPYVNIEPIKGLVIRSQFGVNARFRISDEFTPSFNIDTLEKSDYSKAYRKTDNWVDWNWTNTINWIKSFNHKHNLNVMAGYTMERFQEYWLEGSKERTPTNEENLHYVSAGTQNPQTAGVNAYSSLISYLGRVMYNYNDRYYLTASIRVDGSSKFMKDNQYATFPAVSAAWRISEEPFMKKQHIFDNLKIHAGWGRVGNQNIDNSAYQSTIGSADYVFGGNREIGTAVGSIGNSLIRWETVEDYNIGIDMAFLKNRLSVTAEWFRKESHDMLLKKDNMLILGFPMWNGQMWENVGKMRATGWELSINWEDRKGDFDYGIGLNLSSVKNKAIKLLGSTPINAGSFNGDYIIRNEEGGEISRFYGYVADGYFQSKEEINNYPVYGNNKDNVKPGYIKYKDISGPEGVPDGQITDADRTIIGDPQPRYSFSLNLGAEWNNFDFNVFLQGVGKRDIFFNGAGARPFWMGGTVYEHQLDSWSEENRNAEYPLLLIDGSGGGNMNNIPSSFWVKSGAYMRLKNVSVGYSLPKNILGKSGLSNVRFYLSGQNLLTIAKGYKGYDPEGDVSSYYPVTQVYTFGVDIKF